jgi:Na+/melibiose symporter-like transporter
MLLTGLFTYFAVGLDDSNAFLVGASSKVGLVLLTIFLAWPTLEKSLSKAPALVNGMLLAALIFIAIRPRLLPLIVAGVVITLVVHFGLRFVSTRLENNGR